MANVVDQILASAIDLGVAEAEQYKVQILAAANAAGVNAEKSVDLFINSVNVHGALGLVLPSLKAAVVAAVNQAINNGLASDDILFNLIISAAQNEAKKLAAA
jgi:hypothetical protein